LLHSVSFFNKIQETVDPIFLEDLETILTGDLCLLQYAFESCVGAREQARLGLIGVNTIVAETAREIKTAYEESDKSFNSVKKIFNKTSYLDMEFIYWLYQPPAYQQLEAILTKNVIKNGVDFGNKSDGLILGFGLGFFLLIYFVWRPVYLALKKNREDVQHVFKILPLSVILNNRYIKQYLGKVSGEKTITLRMDQ
jgi:hypothetical protein